MHASYEDEGSSGFVDAEASGGRSQDIETQQHLLVDPMSLIAARTVARITFEESKANALSENKLKDFTRAPLVNLCCMDFYDKIMHDASQGGREALARMRTKLLVEPVEVCMAATVTRQVMRNGNLPLVKCYIEAFPRRRTDFAGLAFFDSRMAKLYEDRDLRRREITRDVRKMRVADIRSDLQRNFSVHEDAGLLSQTKPKLIKVLAQKRHYREFRDAENAILHSMQLEGRNELAALGMYMQEREFRMKWKMPRKLQKDSAGSGNDSAAAATCAGSTTSKKRKRIKETGTEGTAAATGGVDPAVLLKWGMYMDKYLIPLRSFCTRAGELLEEQGRYREAITYYERSSRISFDKGVVAKSVPCAITMEYLMPVSNTIDFANDVSNIALAQKHMEDYALAHKNYKFAMNVLGSLEVDVLHEREESARENFTGKSLKRKKKRRRTADPQVSTSAGSSESVGRTVSRGKGGASSSAVESGGAGTASSAGGDQNGTEKAADRIPLPECLEKLAWLREVHEDVVKNIRRNWKRLHEELTNWSGTSGEFNDIKREYENGPAFWRSSVAVTPEFRRGLPEVTFLIEM